MPLQAVLKEELAGDREGQTDVGCVCGMWNVCVLAALGCVTLLKSQV